MLRLDVGFRVGAESWATSTSSGRTDDQPQLANFALWNARSVKNKTHMISDLVSSHHTDVLVITETWLTGDARDNRTLAELNSTLPSHQFLHSPRIDRTGGGLGVCLHKNFTVNQVECEPMESFEYMELRISCSGHRPLHLVAVYRPQRKKDRSSTSARFFEEFATLLERLVTDPSHLVITGDFNFHVNDQNDNESYIFSDILSSVNLIQHINFPTHVKGHTLDLIITRASDDIVLQTTSTSYLPSDHAAVMCKLAIGKPGPVKKTIHFRKIQDIDLAAFRQDILQSELCTAPSDTIDGLTEQYDTTLGSLLDSHAPEISRTITARPQSPWFNEECQEAKRCLRRLERRWRKSRLEVNRQLFVKESEKYNKMLSEAKTSHFHQELQDCGPREFFSKVSKLLEKSEKILPKVRILNSTLSNLFCNYFATKN